MAAAQDNGSFQSSPWPGEGRRKAPGRHRIHNTTDYYPKGKIIKKGVMRFGSSLDASTQYQIV